MKKLLAILIFILPFASKAQIVNPLDTIVVNGLVLKADVVAVFVGKNASNTDSLSIKTLRTIETQVRAQAPATWNTDVTLNSLSGKAVVEMYEQFLRMAGGVTRSRFDAVRAAFRSRTNILTFIDALEAQMPDIFNRLRDIGKHVLLDD